MSIFNGIINNVMKVFATKSPPAALIPNQQFIWYDRINSKANQKQVLSKEPTFQQLRLFARNSIVRRPISLIKDTISRLEYEFVNVNQEDKKAYKKQKLIANEIVSNPNLIHGRKAFLSMILEDLIVLDAGTFEKAKGKNPSRPLFLYPVDGSTVQFVVPYDYTDDKAPRFAQQQPSEMKYFSAHQLAYLQRNYFTDRPQGLSPILSAFQYIQYLLNANERADSVAGNATADFIISLGSQITPTLRENFITYFAEEIEGTGKIPVISGSSDIDTKQIRAINKDGLYQEWQQFLMTIVAVSFGLPPQKMGILLTSDRATGDDLDKSIMTELVKPYSDIIEDAINEHILKSLGYDKYFKFKFKYEDSQKDKTDKSNRINKEFIAGYISVNEAREKAGYYAIDNKYADMISDERKAQINADINVVDTGGFNGLGDKKNNYDDKVTENKMKEVK